MASQEFRTQPLSWERVESPEIEITKVRIRYVIKERQLWSISS